MSMTDPIADYLSRIRNAILRKKRKVDVPASKVVKEITRILKEEGYIRDYTIIKEHPQDSIRIYLKYDREDVPAITGLRRYSRPGNRIYRGVREIPRTLNGLGIAILTTPKGIYTDRTAKKENVGGEVMCQIW